MVERSSGKAAESAPSKQEIIRVIRAHTPVIPALGQIVKSVEFGGAAMPNIPEGALGGRVEDDNSEGRAH